MTRELNFESNVPGRKQDDVFGWELPIGFRSTGISERCRVRECLMAHFIPLLTPRRDGQPVESHKTVMAS